MVEKFLGGKVEPRDYQINLYMGAKEQNTLIVLPTGLGKTVIAAMVAEYVIMEKKENVLFLAPTKPLVSQHYETLKELLSLDEKSISKFTGEVDNEDRLLRWVTSKLVVSTPQVVINDLRNGLFDISRFGLIVFDEAHRASGNYAYVEIASSFLGCKKRLILAITASPGADRDRLDEITSALRIESVRIKSESDPDVRKYMGGIDIETVILPVPAHIKEVAALLRQVIDNVNAKIRSSGVIKSGRISRSELASKVRELVVEAKNGNKNLFGVIPYVTAAIRLDYLLEYLESQGLEVAYDYISDILNSEEKTLKRTASIVSRMPEFSEFMARLEELQSRGLENSKMAKILVLCEEQISANPDSRVIVFTHFRKTSDLMAGYLKNKSTLLRPARFIGQSSRSGDEGLSQKDQDMILQKFRNNVFNVLVATSVAEEGLDIPATDLVIFFEPVPSEIRSIQRRGRTGRTHAGEVKILIYEGTRDSGYYFSSKRKESRMKTNIERIQDKPDQPAGKKIARKSNLDDFLS